MPIKLTNKTKTVSAQVADAFRSGDDEAVRDAMEAFCASMAEDARASYDEALSAHDDAVMAARGFHQLTAAEQEYWQSVIDASLSSNPTQAFAEMPETAMPATVLEDVLRNIQQQHPLLSAINLQSTSYLTHWVLNKHTAQPAAWGVINDAIAKEIASAFEVVDITQGKLSAFVVVTQDMLQLGPQWLDGYVRAVLVEAMAYGLEVGVVSGTGVKGQPIGLDRDIHDGVTVNTTTGYPAKTAEKVTDLTPETYGALVAKLVKDEEGKNKVNGLGSLGLICSPTDYLTKVMPATTVLAPEAGGYVGNLFPVPTTVYQSVACEDGKAILALMDEYTMFVGGDRGLEYSDEYKFVEDQRVYKSVEYAAGSAIDNTSAIVLDITKLDPAYITVKTKTDSSATGA